MSEKPSPQNDGISRRDFLKMAGATAALGAAGALAGCENKNDGGATTEEMKKNTTEMRVDGEEIASLWDMYVKSGYADKGYDESLFYTAVEELNPDVSADIKRRIVRPGQVLMVPVVSGESE